MNDGKISINQQLSELRGGPIVFKEIGLYRDKELEQYAMKVRREKILWGFLLGGLLLLGYGLIL